MRGRKITKAFVDEVRERLVRNVQVRRTLPSGRLHIDRQVPFLCVYRTPDDRQDLGTEELIKGEAAYLIAAASQWPKPANNHASGPSASIASLLREVIGAMSNEFGAFLLVEIWADESQVSSETPTLRIHAPTTSTMTRTVEALQERLQRTTVQKRTLEVEVIRGGKLGQPDLPPLLSAAECRELRCSRIGVAVPPVYRSAEGKHFPLIAREFRRSLSLALRHAYFEFACSRTTQSPAHYHSLGRRAVVKSVWEVDRQLAQVSNQFDYLLQLTPINASLAWRQFRHDGFKKSPDFHYRPLPVDPSLLKRELFKIPVERVEDPALHQLFEEKQDELELKLTMLRDRDTPRFLHESLQLFGGVDDKLLHLAERLLGSATTKSKSGGKSASEAKGSGKPKSGRPSKVDAAKFAEAAELEFEYYRKQCPDFAARAVVSRKVNDPLVSRGRLLVNANLQLRPSRVPALLAHEVGTHLVTYYNGRLQPFQQLYSGLAGYEELQEGLAVLSEYLSGGMCRLRLRMLAARVIGVHRLTQGASIVETVDSLHSECGFSRRGAFNIAVRIYRGGGLTKDAVYLRGLVALLHYLRRGGQLEPLLVGKMALSHIPIIKELQYRGVLQAPALIPRHLMTEQTEERLERIRQAPSIQNILTKIFIADARHNKETS